MLHTHRVYTSEESDIDKYLSESLKSYKDCKIKNCARRTSLQKKSLGIDIERKLASSKINREEKYLKEHLRQLYKERVKSRTEVKCECCHTDTDEGKDDYVPTDPYPITFPNRSPLFKKKSTKRKGEKHPLGQSRKLSKEFEDLHINTSNGQMRPTPRSNGIVSPLKLSPGLLRKTLSDSGSSLSSLEDGRISSHYLTPPRDRRPNRQSNEEKKAVRRAFSEVH